MIRLRTVSSWSDLILPAANSKRTLTALDFPPAKRSKFQTVTQLSENEQTSTSHQAETQHWQLVESNEQLNEILPCYKKETPLSTQLSQENSHPAHAIENNILLVQQTVSLENSEPENTLQDGCWFKGSEVLQEQAESQLQDCASERAPPGTIAGPLRTPPHARNQTNCDESTGDDCFEIVESPSEEVCYGMVSQKE